MRHSPLTFIQPSGQNHPLLQANLYRLPPGSVAQILATLQSSLEHRGDSALAQGLGTAAGEGRSFYGVEEEGRVSWALRKMLPAPMSSRPHPFLPLLKRAAVSQTMAEIIVLSDSGGNVKFLKPEKALGDCGPTLILQTWPLKPRKDTCSRRRTRN